MVRFLPRDAPFRCNCSTGWITGRSGKAAWLARSVQNHTNGKSCELEPGPGPIYPGAHSEA